MRGLWATSGTAPLHLRDAARAGRLLALLGGILALVCGVVVALPAQPAAAATTNALSVTVVSARDEPRAFGGAGVHEGDAVPEFRFMVNVDATGTTDQRNP